MVEEPEHGAAGGRQPTDCIQESRSQTETRTVSTDVEEAAGDVEWTSPEDGKVA